MSWLQEPTPDEHKDYTVSGAPQSFGPAVDYEPVGKEIILNVYETLLAYNGNTIYLVASLTSVKSFFQSVGCQRYYTVIL